MQVQRLPIPSQEDLKALNPFIGNDNGELKRGLGFTNFLVKNPKASKQASAKLIRSYVLTATCGRRFIGWKNSMLLLSESEVYDALKIEPDEDVSDAEVYFEEAVMVPISKEALKKFDKFIGNADGELERGSADFSLSSTDISLLRGTVLVANLPVVDESTGNTKTVMKYSTLLLRKRELATLRRAMVKRQQKLQQQKSQKQDGIGDVSTANEQVSVAPVSFKETVLGSSKGSFKTRNIQEGTPLGLRHEVPVNQQHGTDTNIQSRSLFAKVCRCLLPSSSSSSSSSSASSSSSKHHDQEGFLRGQAAKTDNKSGEPTEPLVTSFGTPSVPQEFQELVERATSKMLAVASVESWDGNWKRIGQAGGFTWFLGLSGLGLSEATRQPVRFVRGMVEAPARSVFKLLWNDNQSRLEIDSFIEDIEEHRKDIDRTGHNKIEQHTLSSILHEKPRKATLFRHWRVEKDGTILILELSIDMGRDGAGRVNVQSNSKAKNKDKDKDKGKGKDNQDETGMGAEEDEEEDAIVDHGAKYKANATAVQTLGGYVIVPDSAEPTICNVVRISDMDMKIGKHPIWVHKSIDSLYSKMLADSLIVMAARALRVLPYRDHKTFLEAGPLVNHNGRARAYSNAAKYSPQPFSQHQVTARADGKSSDSTQYVNGNSSNDVGVGSSSGGGGGVMSNDSGGGIASSGLDGDVHQLVQKTTQDLRLLHPSSTKTKKQGRRLSDSKYELDQVTATASQAREDVVQRVQHIVNFICSKVPSDRDSYTQLLEKFNDRLNNAHHDGRLGLVASFPFDALNYWVLVHFPGEEAWTKPLVEQMLMQIAEASEDASSTRGGASAVLREGTGRQSQRISQILSRGRERPPSL